MSEQPVTAHRVTGTARVKRGMAEMLKGGVIMDVVTAGAGEDRRGRRRRRRDGARAGARRHPRPGRRVPDERPRHDRRHHRRRLDPGDGQGPHRPLRRGAGAAGARRRLRRRVRGADPGRLRQPHRQVGVHRAVRLRRDQPRRGAAPDHRGRGDDPLQGRGRHRRRRPTRPPTCARSAARSAGCTSLPTDELYVAAKELQAPYELVKEVAETGKLPVVLFTAGGIATPADAAMMMQLGAEGVFVGSGIFKSGNPAQRAAAIVKATTFYDDPDVIAKVSRGLGEAMVGINVDDDPAAAPARRARLVDVVRPSRSTSGVLRPCRATSASTCAALAECGRVGPAGPPARASSTRSTRWSSRRRVDHDEQAGRSTFGLLEPLRKRIADGMPAYGSCAGMIMLADEVLDGRPDQRSLRRHRHDRAAQRVRPAGRLVRGAGGRSTASTAAPFHAVFIRAPWVERVGADVEVLGRVASGPAAGRIVAVRQGNLLATAFHPELTGDLRVHRLLRRDGARRADAG